MAALVADSSTGEKNNQVFLPENLKEMTMEIHVGKGEIVQQALDKAKPGDRLILSPKAIGPVTLPSGAD